MSESPINRIGRFHYLLLALSILLCAVLVLIIGIEINGQVISSLSEMTNYTSEFYFWRFSIYVVLFAIWPWLIRRTIDWSPDKTTWFRRRYLLMIVALYEIVIVLNPLSWLFRLFF